MLILGVDTSGKNGSIALVKFDAGSSRTLEVVALEGGTFSAQLVPQISALLAKHNFGKKDIDGFAVVSGPGSFTGLRVGLAAVKALAETLQKPIAAVSLLEVLMRRADTQGDLLSALDAARNEFFVRIQHGETASEELMTFAELKARTAGVRVITSDQKLAAQLRDEGFNVDLVSQPRADAVARLGYENIQSGKTVDPEALDATYIRRSDAEIMRSSRTPK